MGKNSHFVTKYRLSSGTHQYGLTALNVLIILKSKTKYDNC